VAARTIASIGEFGMLSALVGRRRRARGVIVGPGQDCAVIQCGAARWLLTIDALVAGVHFAASWLSPRQLGRKSFLVNASDIAAMGGQPRFCVVNLSAPPTHLERDLRALQQGIVAAARECGAAVVGGNLTRATALSISIALLGTAPQRLVTRQGARPGDYLYVTGTIGDAAVAVRALQRGDVQIGAALLRRFREPSPRLRAGRVLVERGIVSAMIDVSDGLVQDLGHICSESHVGAVLQAAQVPLSAGYRKQCGTDPRLALRGGEDYELLCAVPEANVSTLQRQRRRLGCQITCIGRITGGRRVRLVDPEGRAMPLDNGGFDHFRV
jgi:thiamine-monophosphate kinase